MVDAPVVLGVSGASGAALGLRIAQLLHQAGMAVEAVISRTAALTLRHELGMDEAAFLPLVRKLHAADAMDSVLATGSHATRGMIIAPCSMRSLSAIAHGHGDSLLTRAADVHLKERRRLIMLTREAPLHLGHLRAMVAATEMGAFIMPPVPAFYLKPASMDAVVDQIARRAIALLNLGPALATAWAGADPAVCG